MHAEEGVARIRDRVDQTVHEIASFRSQQVVLPSERDDAWVLVIPGEKCHAVGLQTGAEHDLLSTHLLAVGSGEDGLSTGGVDADDLERRADRPA